MVLLADAHAHAAAAVHGAPEAVWRGEVLQAHD